MDTSQSVCSFSIAGDECSINTASEIVILVNSIINANTAVKVIIDKAKNAN